jgi:Flp pilus assembly protein TadG
MRAGVTPIITPPRQARAADRPPSRERAMSQPDRERGSLILMLAVMFVGLIALAGLVIDGGAQLTAAENAAAIAQEAARAGAGQVNTATAHENGSFVISEDQAIAAADAYLSGAGYHGVVQPGPGGTDEIEVTVMVTEPTRVLSIIGIDTLHATGRATANLVSGVTGPGQ